MSPSAAPNVSHVLLADLSQRVAQVVLGTVAALETGDEAMARRTRVHCGRVRHSVPQIRAAMVLSREDVAGALEAVDALERIVDLAVELCGLTLAMEETGVPGDVTLYRRMGEAVAVLLRHPGEWDVLPAPRGDWEREPAWIAERLARMARHARQAAQAAPSPRDLRSVVGSPQRAMAGIG